MSRPTATVDIAASMADVFAVIIDPETYPSWLLGAQEIRRIDADWPEVGAAFHHTVGVGPLRVSDHTAVLESQAPELFRLDAHIGVFGSAEVTFRLSPVDGADGRDGAATTPTTPITRVELSEVPRSGVVRVGWRSLGRLWLAFGLWGRNQLTLDQLRTQLERGARRP